MAIGGKNDVTKFGTSGSLTTLVDRSSDVRSVDSNFEKAQEQATTLGDSAHKYESGLEDFTMSITFKYAKAIWNIITAMYSADEAPTVEYHPSGEASGEPNWSGIMNIGSISSPTEVGGIKQFTVEFTSSDGNGATFGTN